MPNPIDGCPSTNAHHNQKSVFLTIVFTKSSKIHIYSQMEPNRPKISSSTNTGSYSAFIGYYGEGDHLKKKFHLLYCISRCSSRIWNPFSSVAPGFWVIRIMYYIGHKIRKERIRTSDLLIPNFTANLVHDFYNSKTRCDRQKRISYYERAL